MLVDILIRAVCIIDYRIGITLIFKTMHSSPIIPPVSPALTGVRESKFLLTPLELNYDNDTRQRRQGNTEMDRLLSVLNYNKSEQLQTDNNIYFTSVLLKVVCFLFFFFLLKIKTIRVFKFEQAPIPECIYDTVHESTSPTNQYLIDHPTFRRVVIILSSVLIDIVFLFLIATFALKARTARVIYAILIFYGIRGICQSLFLFQFPPRWIFDDPGFFSIVVPYGRMSDFYFSGHSGFLMMTTLELIQMKVVWAAFLNFVSMVYTAWMLCTTRAHYSIGIFTVI